MAELAAVAAIIGISSFAFQGIQEAYEFVDGMVKAPDNVKRVATEAKQLQAVLKSIPTQDDAVPVVHTVTQEMELAKVITACDKACHDFVEMLKQWMSNPDEPSLVDRGRVWAHRKAIQTCRDIVRDTKATVTLAEVVAVKRLQVETLRRQGMVGDDVAALLHKEATSEAVKVREEAERTAQLDMEEDVEEEHTTVEQSPMQLDMADNMPVDGGMLGLSSDEGFQDMIRHASSKAIELSKSVVKQHFGNLETDDDNEVKQGLSGPLPNEISQRFGNVKIGSGNKIHQGVYRRE